MLNYIQFCKKSLLLLNYVLVLFKSIIDNMKYVLIIYFIVSLIVMYKTVNLRARLTLFEHLKQLLVPLGWIIVVFYNIGVWLIWVKNNW